MPIVDMPLSQLKEYPGRNPRPADMEAYWDAALAEMRAVDPAVEWVPHRINAPFAECFHLYFTGAGGARVGAHEAQADAARAHRGSGEAGLRAARLAREPELAGEEIRGARRVAAPCRHLLERQAGERPRARRRRRVLARRRRPRLPDLLTRKEPPCPTPVATPPARRATEHRRRVAAAVSR